ncbi:hypothetical protein SAMN02910413_1867 [Pseudobutyrivibrio sp. C4]|uniref:hypothetical protein n=1 Tax=Pseudobutyrivibrio sp. C4 TaxID=1520803 RepID=UPI0008D67C58|nr:hypothetical protein [Pseudobutyrivibrio sp. C4]SET12752.1 hypothetical protein SAMN02910413_1867 [Pseudobutyrivibrio sp. C4]
MGINSLFIQNAIIKENCILFACRNIFCSIDIFSWEIRGKLVFEKNGVMWGVRKYRDDILIYSNGLAGYYLFDSNNNSLSFKEIKKITKYLTAFVYDDKIIFIPYNTSDELIIIDKDEKEIASAKWNEEIINKCSDFEIYKWNYKDGILTLVLKNSNKILIYEIENDEVEILDTIFQGKVEDAFVLQDNLYFIDESGKRFCIYSIKNKKLEHEGWTKGGLYKKILIANEDIFISTETELVKYDKFEEKVVYNFTRKFEGSAFLTALEKENKSFILPWLDDSFIEIDDHDGVKAHQIPLKRILLTLNKINEDYVKLIDFLKYIEEVTL